MRKFLAVILSIGLVFPLLVAGQAALITVSWALGFIAWRLKPAKRINRSNSSA